MPESDLAIRDRMRTSGVLQIGEKRISYWITYQDEPKEDGLSGGKITRLTMKSNGVWDFRFEGGEVKLQTENRETKRALEMLVKAYN